MFKSPIEFLKHAFDEILFLEKEVSRTSEEVFMRDELKQRAFVRSLEIIGEAVKQIPQDFRNKYPDIDWKSYAGLRDKLIHHYFGIDYAIVWDVVANELSDLKIKIEQIIKNNK